MRNLPSLVIDPAYGNDASYAIHFDYDLLGQPMSVVRQSFNNHLLTFRSWLNAHPWRMTYHALMVVCLLVLFPFLIQVMTKIYGLIHVLIILAINTRKLRSETNKFGSLLPDPEDRLRTRAYIEMLNVFAQSGEQPVPLNNEEFEVTQFVLEPYVKPKRFIGRSSITLHLKCLSKIESLKRKFKNAVLWSKCQIPWKETVTKEYRVHTPESEQPTTSKDTLLFSADNLRPIRNLETEISVISGRRPKVKRVASNTENAITGKYGSSLVDALDEVESEPDAKSTVERSKIGKRKTQRKPYTAVPSVWIKCKPRGIQKPSTRSLRSSLESSSTGSQEELDLSGWTGEYKRRLQQATQEAQTMSQRLMATTRYSGRCSTTKMSTAKRKEKKRDFGSVREPTHKTIHRSLQQMVQYYPSSAVPQQLTGLLEREQHSPQLNRMRFSGYVRPRSQGTVRRIVRTELVESSRSDEYLSNIDQVLGGRRRRQMRETRYPLNL